MNVEKKYYIDPCQKGYFLPVPNEIIKYIKYFTGNEIKLLIYMLSTRNTWDRLYGLSREIAAHCGFSKNTVTKLTASLTEKGLLKFENTVKGKDFGMNFLEKGTRHTEVLSRIDESLSKGKDIRFPGIRYLHSAKKEKTSDYRYSTKFEDLFSGGYRKRDIRTDEDRKLGERQFDPFKCSFFHEMTGNEIKLLLFIKYRTAITNDGKAKLSHRYLSEELAVSHKLVASAMKRLIEHFQFVRTENAGDSQLYCINYKEIEIPKRSAGFKQFSQKSVRPYIIQDISTKQNILGDSRFSFSDSEKKELSTSQEQNDSQPGQFLEGFQKLLAFAKKIQRGGNQVKSSKSDGTMKFSPAFEMEAAKLEKEKQQKLNPSYVPEEKEKEQTVIQTKPSEYIKPKLSPAFEMEADRMEREKQQKLNPSYIPEEKEKETDDLEYIFIQKDENTEKLFAELDQLKAERERYIRQAEEKQTKDAPMAEMLRIFIENSIDGKIRDALKRIKDSSKGILNSEQKRLLSECEEIIQNGFSKAA